jgi:type II secretory pathway pseudopilin PulG
MTLPILIVALVVVGGLLSFAVIRVLRWYRARERARSILTAITHIGADFRRDVMIADGNGGSLHLDFLLLTPKGLLVVDLRDVSGNVFGSDQMSEWTVMNGASRFTIPNPLSALYDKVAAVKSCTADAPVEGRIAFTSEALFPKGQPRWVTRVDELAVEFPVTTRDALVSGSALHSAAWVSVLDRLSPSPLRKPVVFMSM